MASVGERGVPAPVRLARVTPVVRLLRTNRISESLLTIAAFIVLRQLGLCADVPVLLFASVTMLAVVVSHVVNQGLHAATQGVPLHLRIAADSASITTVMYMTGWGPALTVGYLFSVANNLEASGSRVVRPCLFWGMVGIAAGQCAIAIGVAPSLVSGRAVYGLAVLGALGFAFITVILGVTTRKKERAESTLQQQASWNQSLLQDLSDLGEGMLVYDDEGRIVYANDAYRRLTGYSETELRAMRSSRRLVAPDTWTALLDRRRRRQRGEPVPPNQEATLVTKDGRRIIVEFSVQQVTAAGRARRLVTLVRDVTERKKFEAKFEGLLRAAPDAMVGVHEDGTITYVNHQAEVLFGYEPDELLGKPIETLVPAGVRDTHPEHRARYLANPQSRPMAAGLDLLGRRKDGSEFPAEVSLSSMTSEDGLLVTAAVRDVTERRRVESALASRVGELAAIAATDPLTGLANRREFERVLLMPRHAEFAVLAVDVDQLKAINDFYGHEAGDVHLQAIAKALHTARRDSDLIARAGGDEFVVFLPDTDLATAAAVAGRLCRTMYGVAVPHGQARISVGCAAGPAGADATQVWAAADGALYQAKQRGGDRVELAQPGTDTTYVTALSRWEPVLRSLIDERRIEPVFQPIIGLDDGRVHGYEALARVSGGPVDTSVEGLFATAQRLGVHRDLDWICRRAALQGAHALPGDRPLFINVGVSALIDPLHDVDQMVLLLRWARRSPALTVLEITEREAVRDLARLTEVLAAYRSCGFRFALDDVGQGYSTFEALAAAMPEFVKVSATLVSTAGGHGSQAIIRSLVSFGEAAGTVLVAEGIESTVDAERMHELGVRLGQGFALGRPAPATALSERSDTAEAAGQRPR